jgi:hypothetical protein
MINTSAFLCLLWFALLLPVAAAAQISIAPAPIDFGGQPVDSCTSLSVLVRNEGVVSCFIDSVGFVGRGISPFRLLTPSLPDSIAPGEGHSYVISFCPFDTIAHADSAFFRVRTIGVGVIDTFVAISGRGTGAPAPPKRAHIRVAPQLLDFDTVVVGTCVIRQLTIYNDSTVYLTIDRSYIKPTDAPFEMLDTAGTDAVMSELTVTIPPGTSRTIRIRFCPDSVGQKGAIDTINSNAEEGPITVALRGVGVLPRIVWSGPARHDFGTVDVGSTVDTTLAFVNLSGLPQSVPEIVPGPNAFNDGFELEGVSPRSGDSVLPRDTLIVSVRFTPRSTALVTDPIAMQPPTPTSITIVLVGRGRLTSEEHAVAIESARATVGEPFDLRVYVTPAFVAADGRRNATVRLTMNPRSLQPLESPGWRIAARVGGSVTYTRTDTSALEGDVLATLRLRPLSTAQPVDSVQLSSVEIESDRTTIASERATITIEGCDIGRDLGLARPMKVVAMSRGADGASIGLEYSAPPGTIPILRVVDRSGVLLDRRALPAGSGSTQRFELDLAGYPPGMLIIELVVGAQRVALPIMHRP